MKLDVNVLRYLSKDDFRTLTAVEMGQKNHEIVPAQLIESIAGLKHGGTFKCLKVLLRHKLVHHDGKKYDGYRLTTLGYDFLAIRALVARGAISAVGRQIGVGKESDVFEVVDDEGNVMALKLHRLGRTSFRAVKSKRDYVKRGNHFSWLYLSRLAALKEFAFMKALGENGLPVPIAVECNRHAVLMSMVPGYPMVQVREFSNPQKVYTECMKILIRLAELGLVHCDFNEFNLLVDDHEQLTLIDFPQMVSTSHPNAEELFDRDVSGVIKFFERKFGSGSAAEEAINSCLPSFQDVVGTVGTTIDKQLRASGFQKEHESVLEAYKKEAEDEMDNDIGTGDSDDDDGDSGDDDGGSDDDDGGSGDDDGEGEEEKGGTHDDPNCEQVIEKEDTLIASESSDDTDNDAASSSSGSEGLDDHMARAAIQAQPSYHHERNVKEQKVAKKLADQRKQEARRQYTVKASRNAMKSKNKGKRKGDASGNKPISAAGW